MWNRSLCRQTTVCSSYDGDVLFTVTTGEVDAGALAVLAAELAWDAVLSSFQD